MRGASRARLRGVASISRLSRMGCASAVSIIKRIWRILARTVDLAPDKTVRGNDTASASIAAKVEFALLLMKRDTKWVKSRELTMWSSFRTSTNLKK